MCVYTVPSKPKCPSLKTNLENKQTSRKTGGDRSVRLAQPIHQNAHIYFLLSPSNRSRCRCGGRSRRSNGQSMVAAPFSFSSETIGSQSVDYNN